MGRRVHISFSPPIAGTHYSHWQEKFFYPHSLIQFKGLRNDIITEPALNTDKISWRLGPQIK